jgi:hypothetical protein
MRRIAAGPSFSVAGEPKLQGYVDCLLASPGLGTPALARKRFDLLAAEVARDWMGAAGTVEAGEVFGFRGRNAGGVGHLLQRRLGFAPEGELALQLTAAGATELQLGPEREAKEERLRKYYALATGSPGDSPQAAEIALGWLERVWESGGGNSRKEKAFLLAYNGFGTAARRRAVEERCSCGSLFPGRAHHFWECPVATAVLDAVCAGMPPGTGLRRENVWLGLLPGCQVDRGVWTVTAVAAIEAMAQGRSLLVGWKLSKAQGAGAPPPEATRVGKAAAHAALAFWASLQEFASMKYWPKKWAEQVAEDGPFLRRQGDTLVVVGPWGGEG